MQATEKQVQMAAQLYEMREQGIKVGDMVQTGVYVLGEWRGIYTGRVVQQSSDGTTCQVDVMSHNGGRPWVHFEATIHLRKLDTPNGQGKRPAECGSA